MKLEKNMVMSTDKVSGFVKILDFGKAQQTRIGIERLIELGKLCKTLYTLGFDEVIITVEKDCPIIIGGKELGFAIAPIVLP